MPVSRGIPVVVGVVLIACGAPHAARSHHAETVQARAREAAVGGSSDVEDAPAVHRGVATWWFGGGAILAPSGMFAEVEGLNEVGGRGLPPGEYASGRLVFPERITAMVEAASGLVFVTPSGRLYGTGTARPGPEWELGLVELPGPAEYPCYSLWGVCAAVRGRGVYCWGDRIPGGPEPPWSSAPQRVPEAPAAVAALASGGGRLCALEADGALWCWQERPHAPPEGRPSLVARDVHAIEGSSGGWLCAARGDERRLWCWGDARLEGQLPLRNVSSIGGGEHMFCAIGTDDVRPEPWVYCWGIMAGWIMVGPNGVSIDALSTIMFTSEVRPVLPVEEGTEVIVIGLLLCLRDPDGSTRCDPTAHPRLREWYGVGELPRGTRPFPGSDVLRNERFEH